MYGGSGVLEGFVLRESKTDCGDECGLIIGRVTFFLCPYVGRRMGSTSGFDQPTGAGTSANLGCDLSLWPPLDGPVHRRERVMQIVIGSPSGTEQL